ncbi:ZYRO0G05676p [Zygosaccharomyces rouxii]|uniref:Centractin n=1 Tax=Zygosaccharomyces rouxii (strain ATCC 2623 / CBS 732 / NBRC 1130 / NCYC 568 / NRRL Y-229) TaxID=559307 RepID=C5DZM6_ZYGRC|nr:uncharacterized protein ZYRO0G05676g [Zygosaccharomyces rouxii]KAH9202307.1 actin family [Zygosaccharomyces rouxii]CAR29310.1 ZYRO0G05676p [Zygosaccharomyces rouxii]
MLDPNAVLYSQPVVLDNGSAILKAGYSGEDRPKFLEHSIVGSPRHGYVNDSSKDDTFVGNLAQERRSILQLRHPVDHGVVKNWNDMELIWDYMFKDKLKLKDVDEHPVLITEAPLNPVSNRDEMCDLLFESFGVQALYVANPAVLSLYASGKISGCVLDCGDGYSCSVPVYQGYTLKSAIKRIDLGGRDLTEQLQLQLRKSTGLSLTTSGEMELVRMIKEKSCYVAVDLDIEEEKCNYEGDQVGLKFKLPDGKFITLSKDRFQVPEILFQPSVISSEVSSIPEIIWQSVSKLDTDLRPQMWSDILLSGGTTMLKGFGNRLVQELDKLNQAQSRVKIWAPPERKYTSWIGGSILAELSTFQKIIVTKSQWQEDPSIIHTKCG